MPEPSFLLGVREFGEILRFVTSREHPQKTMAEAYFGGPVDLHLK